MLVPSGRAGLLCILCDLSAGSEVKTFDAEIAKNSRRVRRVTREMIEQELLNLEVGKRSAGALPPTLAPDLDP